ncbi:baseplate protein [Streptomyces albiflavescens]|uniref:Baseplate protein n=1 Tax=Streptomyces albiflavescens TaxID=1623582 RepID=A0A917YFC1_9ACTN|nr:GPW/gp25 family protein [Streptomyces albiflavescens]GGN94504.1 baseplate protein [Streptomyces albiflavescens]
MGTPYPDPARAFLGTGWAFPPRVEPDGRIAEAVYEEDVRQAIVIILGTDPGERVMRPRFGAGLSTFVFEPMTAALTARIAEQVRNALTDWEPRIDVVSVEVMAQERAAGTLLIDVSYRVRATNTLRNLVYPFYLGEGAGT